MPYNGGKAHRDILLQALKILRDERHQSFVALEEAIRVAIADKKIPGANPREDGISRQTMEGYLNHGFEKGFKPEKVRILFNFLELSEEYATPVLNRHRLNVGNTPDASFFVSVSEYFKSPYTRDYGRLSCLVGQYAMFRPAWTNRNPQKYVRSIVTIEAAGDLLTYGETQNYIDGESQVHVNARDVGFVFETESNVFVLSKEISGQWIKFLSFHEFSCPLGADYSVDTYKGHVMGLTGGKAAPGMPFIARRIFDDDLTSRIVDFSGFDDITQEFFHEYYEDSRKRGERPKR